MLATRQFCLTTDLRSDPELILEYEDFHRPGNVWPEVLASIRQSGILDMQIYRLGLQLIMVITVDDSFSFAGKAAIDGGNKMVMKWESLMTKFQNAAADSETEGKWQEIDNIFNLQQHP